MRQSRAPAHIKDWAWDGPGEFYVATAYGWAFDPHPDQNAACHVHIYETVKEARAEAKWVKPCSCLRCTSLGQAPGC